VNAVANTSRIRPLGRGSSFGGLAATILIHVSLAALIYFAHVKSPPPVEVPRDLIVTKLVAFGKPREKFWLPRIVQPPRPKAPPPSLKLTDDPNAAPAPKEAPKIEDADISKDMRRALKRAQMLAQATEEPAEGSLSGSALGRSTEGATGDAWATAVDAAIHSAWVTPVGLITDAELAGLKATVRISVSDDGTLQNPVVQKSSGNSYFDDSLVRAVKSAGKVPPPPSPKYKRLNLVFDGSKMGR
jgi:TonB family protein